MTKRIDCCLGILTIASFRLLSHECSVIFFFWELPHLILANGARVPVRVTCISVCGVSLCVCLDGAPPIRGVWEGCAKNLKAFSTLSLVLIDGLGTRHSPNMAPSVQDCSRVYGCFFFISST